MFHFDPCVSASTGFLLSVMTPSGSVKKVVVQLDTKIREVKQELEREDGVVSASRQRLMVRGEEMQDHKRLRDYGITRDSVIRMEVTEEEEEEEECCVT